MSLELTDLNPQLPAGYLQWEEEQQKARNQYQTCFVYLPLFSHPNQHVDKGYLRAGLIEMVIPFPQDALLGEAPPSHTQRVKALPSYVPMALSTETLGEPGSPSESLRTMNARMSQVSGNAEHKLEYFARPKILAGYAISSQARWGGRILKTLENMSPAEYFKAKLNEFLFMIERRNEYTEQLERVVIPQVHTMRVAHFKKFLGDGDRMITGLAKELIEAEAVAFEAARSYIDRRDQEREQGENLNTSAKDRICLTYLDRKWKVEAANDVLKQQEARQQSIQEQLLEAQKQNAETNKQLAEAVKALNERPAPPVQIVLTPEALAALAPSTEPAKPETTNSNKSGNNNRR